jgi:glycosyltransferase involved in cell wall biosynthesis
MKRVLMVAYHFPPLAGSSGIQRTLRFVQHLPAFGWQPLVLTIRPSAYERTNPDLDGAIPSGTVVRRAFGLDTARHLSVGGRYAAWTARPDRWMTWRLDGVRQGLQMIREFKPQALWSTYPIATAHVIGAELQQRSGLPWIADFRDPMAQDDYPTDPVTWRHYADIESRTLRQASLSTFTTPSASRLYAQRYPDVAERIGVLENGYDEESFPADDLAEATAPLNPGSLTLLHSGIVYAAERDPTQLFEALRRLKEARNLRDGVLRVRFRAAVHEDLLHDLAAKHQVQDCIEVCPPVPYREALQEMMRADGLLVLQAANCNAQIPAKIYEYLRAGRPVICLSHPEGDTEVALRSAGIKAHARLDDSAAIGCLLAGFVADAGTGELLDYLPHKAAVEGASRRGRTRTLAAQLDRLSVPT